jgi:hypothetical protein
LAVAMLMLLRCRPHQTLTFLLLQFAVLSYLAHAHVCVTDNV